MAFIGILFDFPVSNDGLQDSVSAFSPPVGESLPWIALGGLASCLVLLAYWSYVWVLDRLNDGPSARSFQALAPRISKCKSNLIEVHDSPNVLLSGAERASKTASAIYEAGSILDEFERLDVSVPEFNELEQRGQMLPLIVYLSGMESLAKGGDINQARHMDGSHVD